MFNSNNLKVIASLAIDCFSNVRKQVLKEFKKNLQTIFVSIAREIDKQFKKKCKYIPKIKQLFRVSITG